MDRVYPKLTSYDELSQLLFSDIIKSRLVGKAKEIIEINTQFQSWEDIKRTLQNNFGERKSCDELYDDLRATTVQTNTLAFYNDIKYKLSRLYNKSVIVLGEGEAANQVSIHNQRTALYIFKSKIPEPMKTILACRNPTSLETAIDILYENGYDQMGRDGHICSGKAKQTASLSKSYHNRNNRSHIVQNNAGQNNKRQQNSGQFYRNTDYHQQQHYRQQQQYRPQQYQSHQQNVNWNNRQEPRWRNNENYQPAQPMEVNNSKNFHHVASTEKYHI